MIRIAIQLVENLCQKICTDLNDVPISENIEQLIKKP